MALKSDKKKKSHVEETTVGRPKVKKDREESKFPVNSFDEQMAALAAQQKKAEANTAVSSISTKGGKFTINGKVLKSGNFNAVVVESAFTNVYYPGRFQADQNQSPVCYAFAREQEDLKPHAECEDAQCDNCADCPLNVFGTSETGSGKACKNQRRLALIMEGDLKDSKAPIYVLNVSVTSIKAWKNYVQSVIDAQEKPTIGVLTNISIEIPDGQTHGQIDFEFVEELSSKELGMVFPRREEAYRLITQAFPKNTEDTGKKPAKDPFKGGKFTKEGRGKGREEREAPVKKKSFRR